MCAGLLCVGEGCVLFCCVKLRDVCCFVVIRRGFFTVLLCEGEGCVLFCCVKVRNVGWAGYV